MEIIKNWWEEKRSAYVYGIMAAKETNILHKKLFADLQKTADKQALSWEKKMKKEGITPPAQFTPDFRTRLVALMIKIVGVDGMHKILSAMKIRGMSLFTRFHDEHKHTSLNASSNLRAAIFGMNDG